MDNMSKEFDEFFNEKDVADEDAALDAVKKRRGRPKKDQALPDLGGDAPAALPDLETGDASTLPDLDADGAGGLPDLTGQDFVLPDISLEQLSSGELPEIVLVDSSADDGQHLLEPLPELEPERVERIRDSSGDFSSDYETAITDDEHEITYAENEPEEEEEEQDIDAMLASMAAVNEAIESGEDNYFDVYEDGELDVLHNFKLDEILGDAIDMGASDVHLSADDKVSFSILGAIHRLDIYPDVTGTMMQRLQQSILSNVLEDSFINELELDTSYQLKEGKHRGRRTRLSVGKSKGEIFMVFRIVANTMPRPHELGVTGDLLEWINLPNGLVMMNGPTGTGKALRLDTPIPTPSGFKTMGELAVGDVLYDSKMQPCRVSWVSSIDEKPVLYAVKLSDGQVIYADGNHKWIVSSHDTRNSPRHPKVVRINARKEHCLEDAKKLLEISSRFTDEVFLSADALFTVLEREKVTSEFHSSHTVYMTLRYLSCPYVMGVGSKKNVYPAATAFRFLSKSLEEKFTPVSDVLYTQTTEELLATGLTINGRSNFAIPVVAANNEDAIELPINPYVLGAWLGDGSSDRGSIASGFSDYEEMMAILATRWQGIVLPVKRERAVEIKLQHEEDGVPFRTILRSTNLYLNKHIPDIYFNASYEQRLELLRGLMDTDGSVDKRSGIATFSGKNERLVSDVARLVRSLGFKTSLSKKKAACTTKDGNRKDCGFSWNLNFVTNEEVFALSRKRKFLPASVSERQKWLYIKEIVEVSPDDENYGAVRCIAVDSEDHSFLCHDYVVTHNSTTLASMLQEIQFTRAQKIITLERPIEYVFGTEGEALITQREVGRDARSFANALTSAMRQAPDIIMVGEVRNRLEVNELLRAAETGHLAISTMHTNSAATTINRIKSLYEGDDQLRILASLSDVSRGFANQVLLPTLDGKSRFAVREVLTVDEEVAALIAEGDVKGIRDYQEARNATMEHALAEAALSQQCTYEAAKAQAPNPRLFDKIVQESS